MKRVVSVLVAALLMVALVAVICWHPVQASPPDTGLTVEAVTELAAALEK